MTHLSPSWRALALRCAFVPDLHNLNLRGGAYWVTKDKAVIIVSDRMKLENRFWFALFHEAMHVLLTQQEGTFHIDYGGSANEQPSEEREADEAAANTLITAQQLQDFFKPMSRLATVTRSLHSTSLRKTLV